MKTGSATNDVTAEVLNSGTERPADRRLQPSAADANMSRRG